MKLENVLDFKLNIGSSRKALRLNALLKTGLGIERST
jgi:hypothetical protein